MVPILYVVGTSFVAHTPLIEGVDAVIGMVILFGVLAAKGGVPADLARVGDTLLANLSLLFVPAGVGVMAHFALLANDWPALGAAIIGSTLITVAVTALVMVWLSRLTGGRDAGDGEPVDREGQV